MKIFPGQTIFLCGLTKRRPLYSKDSLFSPFRLYLHITVALQKTAIIVLNDALHSFKQETETDPCKYISPDYRLHNTGKIFVRHLQPSVAG